MRRFAPHCTYITMRDNDCFASWMRHERFHRPHVCRSTAENVMCVASDRTPCGSPRQLRKLSTPCASLRTPCGLAQQLRKLNTPCASLRTSCGPAQQLRKLNTPCASLHVTMRVIAKTTQLYTPCASRRSP